MPLAETKTPASGLAGVGIWRPIRLTSHPGATPGGKSIHNREKFHGLGDVSENSYKQAGHAGWA